MYHFIFRIKKVDISENYICNIIKNITLFPNGDVYPCYLFSKNNYKIGENSIIYQNNFIKIYNELYNKMLIKNVSKLINKNLEYKKLIGDICAGDVFYNEDNPSLSEHINFYYKSMINLVGSLLFRELKENKEDFEIIKSNVFKTYEKILNFLHKNTVKKYI